MAHEIPETPEGCKRLVRRVQDSEGRGPYRPGFPQYWSDLDGPLVPLWWEEVGDTMEHAHRKMGLGYHWGCGFTTGAQLALWFSPAERRKLHRLGFHVAMVQADRVIAETPTQIVFGSKAPFSNPIRKIRLTSAAAET